MGGPFPSPEDLPNRGIEPRSPMLQADGLLSEPPGKSQTYKATPVTKNTDSEPFLHPAFPPVSESYLSSVSPSSLDPRRRHFMNPKPSSPPGALPSCPSALLLRSVAELLERLSAHASLVSQIALSSWFLHSTETVLATCSQ